MKSNFAPLFTFFVTLLNLEKTFLSNLIIKVKLFFSRKKKLSGDEATILPICLFFNSRATVTEEEIKEAFSESNFEVKAFKFFP